MKQAACGAEEADVHPPQQAACGAEADVSMDQTPNVLLWARIYDGYFLDVGRAHQRWGAKGKMAKYEIPAHVCEEAPMRLWGEHRFQQWCALRNLLDKFTNPVQGSMPIGRGGENIVFTKCDYTPNRGIR